jgi:hypothetical protein
MSKVCSIVFYGGSLSIMALEAALQDSAIFRVVHLDPEQPDFGQILQVLQPDVVISNTCTTNPYVAADCLQLALDGETMVLINHDGPYVVKEDDAQQQLALIRTTEGLIEFLAKYTGCSPQTDS